MTIWLLRLLPPELAHNIAIWSLRTGFWRVGLILDALVTLTWAWPALGLLRLLEWLERRSRKSR